MKNNVMQSVQQYNTHKKKFLNLYASCGSWPSEVPALGNIKWKLRAFVVSLIDPPFFSFHSFTLRNYYDERDKTTTFLENKGPGPMADLGSTKSAPLKAPDRRQAHRTRDQLILDYVWPCMSIASSVIVIF